MAYIKFSTDVISVNHVYTACYFIGIIWMEGYGTRESDFTEALKWFERSLEEEGGELPFEAYLKLLDNKYYRRVLEYNIALMIKKNWDRKIGIIMILIDTFSVQLDNFVALDNFIVEQKKKKKKI